MSSILIITLPCGFASAGDCVKNRHAFGHHRWECVRTTDEDVFHANRTVGN